MSRERERMATFARAAARRFAAGARRLFTTEPGSETGDAVEVAGARELARSAGELRGGMAKVAQLMAYLQGPGGASDVEARRALAALWDQAPGVSREAVRGVIEADLGGPPEKVFDEWDDEPMAAASLGQVHRARKGDVALAVKVQYPGVAEALRSDLDSPRMLRRLAGAEVGGTLSPEAIARLRDAVLAELDYAAEARWLERFRKAFRFDKEIVVPQLHAATSSARVLSAELVEGKPLPLFAAEAGAEARARVALALFRFAWGAPLRHRLLNADPNPGNYLVLEDGRTAFLDFGCAVELDEEVVEADRRLWRALLAGDAELLRHAVHTEGLVARAHARTLDSSTYREWERYLAGPFLSKQPFRWTSGYARRFAELTSLLARAGGLVLPPGAVLLWRARLGVAAVLGQLEPEMDFEAALRGVLAA